jgi:hypothetical protein
MGLASESVFPRGVMVLGSVEPELDFDARQRGAGDVQAKDEATGLPVWVVNALDMRVMDPEQATGFREEVKVKVRVLSATAPELPKPQMPGMGPVVAFDGLLVTPYISTDRCNGSHNGRCRAELKYSLRATGLRPFKG